VANVAYSNPDLNGFWRNDIIQDFVLLQKKSCHLINPTYNSKMLSKILLDSYMLCLELGIMYTLEKFTFLRIVEFYCIKNQLHCH